VRKYTTGEIYLEFDKLADLIEGWVSRKSPKVFRCSNVEVSKRLTQRIVEIISNDFTSYMQSSSSNHDDSLKKVTLNGINVCLHTGAIKISLKQYVGNILLFGASWAQLFFSLLFNLLAKGPKNPVAATLFMEPNCGLGESDAKFVEFCREKIIQPLSSAKILIVKSKTQPTIKSNDNFIYTSQPLVYFASSLLNRKHKFLLFWCHFKALIYFFLIMFKSPILVLLGRDLSYIPVCDYLERKNLIQDIIITTSSFTTQPLWMKGLSNRNSHLHMVWYSQNFIPKMYRGDESVSNLPSARHMRVDTHWVWTDGFGQYLKNLGQTSNIHVVGPILWYMPKKEESYSGQSSIKIAVFDVTPVAKTASVFGAAKNYYSSDTMTKFLNDIVDICADIKTNYGKNIEILLKHKRSVTSREDYDLSYIKLVDELNKKRSEFRTIPHDVNLYGLLEVCDVSISIPYTSTAYVSAKYNKPSLYYDPFAELVPQYEKNGYVNFVAGRTELKEVLYQLLA